VKNNLPTRITRRDFLKNTAGLCLKMGLSSIFLYSCQPDAAHNETTTPVERASIKKTATPVEISPVKRTTTPVETSSLADSDFEPAYLKFHKTGELRNRAQKLWAIMESCQLCPRRCGVNRLEGRSGFCGAPGATLVVSAFHPHYGEERPLVGRGGSGTIFLTHCNLRCVFCQNWEISQRGQGYDRTIAELAEMMLRLQKIGCHNINLVTPTH